MILRYLTGMSSGPAPPHDHLDDLEGIFFLTSFLMFQYKPDGTERARDDKAGMVVRGWDSENPLDSLSSKMSFFNPASGLKRNAVDILSKSWGPACATLFESYWMWVREMQIRKDHILEETEMQGLNAVSGGNQRSMMVEEDTDIWVEGVRNRGEVTGEFREYQYPQADDDEGDDKNEDVLSEEEELEACAALLSPPIVETQVPLQQGIFAPLMDSASEDYRTILEFFSVAISAIENSPETQGPPPVPKQAPKRKSPSSEALTAGSKLKKSKKGNTSRSKRTSGAI